MKSCNLLVAVAVAAGCGDNGRADDDVPTCAPGLVVSGTACVDIDECLTGIDDCAARATCDNTVGDFTCTCPPGWSGDGTACAPPPCRYQYDEGHGDIYATYDAATGLTLDLRTEVVAGAGEVRSPPLEVCINVPRSTYDEVVGLGGRPPAPGWDGVGVAAGEPFWYLPEQPIDGVPWFGIASDVSAVGGIPPGVFGDRLILMLAIEGPPDAELSAWGSVDDPDAPPFIFSTPRGLLVTEPFTGSHAHLSWAFTRAGEYLVEARIGGTLSADGRAVTSAPTIFRFVVAE